MRRADFHFDLPPELIAQRRWRSARPAGCCASTAPAAGCETAGSPTCRSCCGQATCWSSTTRVSSPRGSRHQALRRPRRDLARARRRPSASRWCRCAPARPARRPAHLDGRRRGRRSSVAKVISGAWRRPARSWRSSSPRHTPLPPYITRAADDTDRERYQSLLARVPGAVAAPTASLHFDAALLARLEALGVRRAAVTLHVGAGTFQPLRVDDLAEHLMHAERYDVPAGAWLPRSRAPCGRGGGWSRSARPSLRALESRCRGRPAARRRRGDARSSSRRAMLSASSTRCCTNFHLPESTLLMLVARSPAATRCSPPTAMPSRERYRFFSYGDAMLDRRRKRTCDDDRRYRTAGAPTARRGAVACTCDRGVIETPAFMPVGTYGTVKAMTPEELERPRRADRARQHLPPDAAARARTDRRASAGCTASCTGRGRSSPTPVASRCSASPSCARSRGGRAVPLADRRHAGVPDARGLDGRAARAGSDIAMCFDDCTPCRRRRRRRAIRWSARCAGRARCHAHYYRARRPRAPVRHRAGRHVRRPAPGLARGAGRASAFPASRSAAWRSASRSEMRLQVLEDSCRGLPARPAALPHGRRPARGHHRGGAARAWTCSTA